MSLPASLAAFARSLTAYTVSVAFLGGLAALGFGMLVAIGISITEWAMVENQGAQPVLAAAAKSDPASIRVVARSLSQTATIENVRVELAKRADDDDVPALPYVLDAAVAVPPSPSSSQASKRSPASKTGTYRTVCVRLCDGYQWPISHSTTPDRFAADETRCDSSCGTPTRLFVMPAVGGAPETMVDLDGQPYTRLSTAFKYRSAIDASCRCSAHPWQQASLDRHNLYALEAAARKGASAPAGVPMAELKAKVEAHNRKTAARKEAAKSQLMAAGVIKAPDPSRIAALFPAGRASKTERIQVASREDARHDKESGRSYSSGGNGTSWQARAFAGN